MESFARGQIKTFRNIGRLCGIDCIVFGALLYMCLNNSSSSPPLCSQFQPSYQTYYKKSFRVSNYGKDKLVDLLMDCPHLKLINNVVYLQTALMDPNNSPLHLISSSFTPAVSTSPTNKPLSSLSSPLEDSNKICYVCNVCIIISGSYRQ